jgi:hypothetical protein
VDNNKISEYIAYYYEISQKYTNIEVNLLKLEEVKDHPKKINILEELCKKCIILDITHEIAHGKRDDLLFSKMIKKMRSNE